MSWQEDWDAHDKQERDNITWVDFKGGRRSQWNGPPPSMGCGTSLAMILTALWITNRARARFLHSER